MTYVATWAGLVVLALATYLLARAQLGVFQLPVAMAIAVVKGLLVVLVFMHLLEHGSANRIFFLVAFLFIVLLVALTTADVATRSRSADVTSLESLEDEERDLEGAHDLLGQAAEDGVARMRRQDHERRSPDDGHVVDPSCHVLADVDPDIDLGARSRHQGLDEDPQALLALPLQVGMRGRGLHSAPEVIVGAERRQVEEADLGAEATFELEGHVDASLALDRKIDRHEHALEDTRRLSRLHIDLHHLVSGHPGSS
jgi:caa(3)-type oxidase subunit IV